MKTTLKIVTRNSNEYIDIPNPYNMIPRKGDNFVWKEQSYIVSYVEFDFDTNTLFIISTNLK